MCVHGYGVQKASHLRVSYEGASHTHTCGHFRRVDADAAVAAPDLEVGAYFFLSFFFCHFFCCYSLKI